MTQLDRDRAEDRYLAAVAVKEAAEIRATEAWVAYDSRLDLVDLIVRSRAYLDAIGAVDRAEADCAEAFAIWQDLEERAMT